MKIIIDTDLCKRDGKDPGVMLYLASLLCGSKITVDTFERARQQQFLKFEKMYDRRFPFPDTVSLSSNGEYVIEDIIAKSNIPENSSEDRFESLAEKLRELFPAGKKPGYAYTWRDSVSCIAERLRKFCVKYDPDYKYTDEQIIDATKRYVNSFNGNYTYMQLLKYFIWKNKVTEEQVVRGRIVGEVEKQSQLAAWLEDTEEAEVTAPSWDIAFK